ncbi:MAG TPA: helix-turn-helix transcriptional regulator [Bacillales bacterium]|nr:helix-turn-helix transcriptional regulator [Bacillales bacterium]
MDGQTLRVLRRSIGMTQAQLAQKVGIDVCYVSLMERGYKPVPAKRTKAIEAALGISREQKAVLLAAHELLEKAE